jgi:DNA-binding transcriptional MerR regulator
MGAFSSSQVARMLGVAPVTLRKWSTEFAAWLSPGAVAEHQRSYADADLAVLRRAAELLARRRDYARARTRIAAEFATVERERAVGEHVASAPEPSFAPDDAATAVEAEVIEPEPRVPPDIAGMLERMADLYKELLREKEHEIAALSHALDAAELSAANQRRELETTNKLAQMMEREHQRLSAELEDARRRLGELPQEQGSMRGRLARWLGLAEESQRTTQA